MLAGKSKTRAARDAGYAKSVGKNAKAKLDDKPAVAKLFKDLMEKAGITDERLAKRIAEGLNANVLVRENLYAKREVLVDFAERREMVELAIRMKGLMPAEEHKHEVTLEELLDGSWHE